MADTVIVRLGNGKAQLEYPGGLIEMYARQYKGTISWTSEVVDFIRRHNSKVAAAFDLAYPGWEAVAVFEWIPSRPTRPYPPERVGRWEQASIDKREGRKP